MSFITHPERGAPPPPESILFLDRPAVPDLARATDIAPQLRAESLRIDGLRPGRRRPLHERVLEPDGPPA